MKAAIYFVDANRLVARSSSAVTDRIMMIKTYLLVNAALYFLFSAWCVISPVKTASFIGFTTTSPAGQSEWMAVYGGLQGALGLFFLHAGLSKRHQSSAILMACYLYTGLVALRLFSVYDTGLEALGNAKLTLGLEAVLALGAYFSWWLGYSFSSRTGNKIG